MITGKGSMKIIKMYVKGNTEKKLQRLEYWVLGKTGREKNWY